LCTQIYWQGLTIPPIGTLKSDRKYAYAGLRRLPAGTAPHLIPVPGRQLERGASGSSLVSTSAPSEIGGAVPARAGSGGHTEDKGATPQVDGGSGGEVVSAWAVVVRGRVTMPGGARGVDHFREDWRDVSAEKRPERPQATNPDCETFGQVSLRPPVV